MRRCLRWPHQGIHKMIAFSLQLKLGKVYSQDIQSVMVSVGVSQLGSTHLIFVHPGVKINGDYYRDVLLMQEILPVIRDISGEFFILQPDGAPAHRARDTVKLL